ncbi:MAG: hypothetical protein IJ890_02270 [Clostridia bacterium]|nr:hypothetical protein [Clostridia bacterium]
MYNNFLPPPPFFRKNKSNFHYSNQHQTNKFFSTNDNLKIIQKENIPEQKNNQNKDCNQPDLLFEILGIKIYFDDLLLICILFFLYQEGIQDEYLFIALILLLLS